MAKVVIVETTEMAFSLPSGAHSQIVRIVEKPAQHIIGDHVWHSSIVFAYWLAYIRPFMLVSDGSGIIELGAGCGLASLVAAATFPTSVTIIATDLAEVVNTTLRDNLLSNSDLGDRITATTLEWGDIDASNHLAAGDLISDCLIFAVDVLYNQDSHTLLLASLEGLFIRFGAATQAYIGYKHRIAGDGDFFDMARQRHFRVAVVYRLADVEIWRMTSPR